MESRVSEAYRAHSRRVPDEWRACTVDDPRIPDALRGVLRDVQAAAIPIDVFEVPGNPLCVRLLAVQMRVSWASELARRLRACGAHNGCLDEYAAAVDPGAQFVEWQEVAPSMPALFRLVRREDVTGVSGTGHVADGAVWHDGKVTVHWRTAPSSTGHYDSLDDVLAIHGHHGATAIEWYPALWRDPLDGGLVETFRGPELGTAFRPEGATARTLFASLQEGAARRGRP